MLIEQRKKRGCWSQGKPDPPEEVDSKEEEGLQGLWARGTPAKGLEARTLGTQLARVPAGHLQDKDNQHTQVVPL